MGRYQRKMSLPNVRLLRFPCTFTNPLWRSECAKNFKGDRESSSAETARRVVLVFGPDPLTDESPVNRHEL